MKLLHFNVQESLLTKILQVLQIFHPSTCLSFPVRLLPFIEFLPTWKVSSFELEFYEFIERGSVGRLSQYFVRKILFKDRIVISSSWIRNIV